MKERKRIDQIVDPVEVQLLSVEPVTGDGDGEREGAADAGELRLAA